MTMRALQLLADRDIALGQRDPPPPPAPGEVQLRVRAVGLNHIDVWGFRGMAFAKRRFPLCVGAEASCEVIAVGDDVSNVRWAIASCPMPPWSAAPAAPANRAREPVRERRRRARLPR